MSSAWLEQVNITYQVRQVLGLTWIQRAVAGLVEVLDPLRELSTVDLIAWQLAPLHEDVEDQFPNFIPDDLLF